MLPKPRADLKPNTAEFECLPLVKPTGFREYDARWLFPQDINLMGLNAIGLGLATLAGKRGRPKRFVVGHDYRSYSASVKQALINGLLAGGAELRYMTGQGGRVLARRALEIVAAEVTLSAADEAAVGSAVAITWTGPNNPGDYLTVVAKETPDGQYGDYTATSAGSPTPLAPQGPSGSGSSIRCTVTGGTSPKVGIR